MARTVTVTGSWAGTGWVLLQPIDRSSLPAVGTIVATTVETRLVANALPAATSVVIPDGAPEPVLFDVRVLLDGQPPAGAVYAIPIGAAAVDLDDLIAVLINPIQPGSPPDGPTPVHAIVGWEHVGAPGGVAPLGVDRKVPVLFLPAGVVGVSTYLHIQATPAASWLVTHNMDRLPQVTTLDQDGMRVWPDLEYPDTNSVVVMHGAPLAGQAVLVG